MAGPKRRKRESLTVVLRASSTVVTMAFGLTACSGVSSPPPSTSASQKASSTTTTNSHLPSCGGADLRLAVGAQGENTGVVVLAALFVTKGNTRCRVTTQAVLTLVDGSGNLLAVEGNPATATDSGIADPTQPDFTNIFYWFDWCGPRNPSPRIQVKLPELGLEQTITPPLLPVCIGR